jgi:hypothetical protein
MSPLRQEGLTLRMGRESSRISSQHRQLDEHCDVVRESLARGDGVAARRAFERFLDALEAHLSLEEGLYFPALHGLAPVLEDELGELVRQHGDVRASMERVRVRLESDLAGSGDSLEAAVSELRAHERREEALIERIRRGVSGAA